MKEKMKSVARDLLLALGVIALAGCATKGDRVAAPQPSPPQPAHAEAPPPPLPDIELTPELLNKVLLADVAIQRAQYDVAVELYRELALGTRDPRLAERATRVALFARDMESARQTGAVWLELDPSNIDARQIMTALYVKSGDFDAALDLLEGLLAESSRDDHDRYMLILRLLGREQDKDGARELMERYLERHPDDVAGLYAYAQLALRDGKTDAADSASTHLLEIKPDWTPAIVLRTRILQATNRGEEALDYLRSVVERQGDDTILRAALGRMLLDAGKYAEAQEQFEEILEREPDKVDILFLAGGVALQLQQLDRAERHFRRLYELGERQNESAFFLGDIEERKGNIDAAIEWYDKVRGGASQLDALGRSALLQARRGDVEGGLAHLASANPRSDAQRVQLILIEGEILREVGRYQDAFDVYSQGLERYPGHPSLLYARAMVADKLGRLVVVEHDLRAILERQPDHVEALNSLGYILADRTDRYEEALGYIERALELRPDAFHIMDSYGWVQYRLGNFEEAVRWLRRAIDKQFDPEIAAHLGEVLWVMGERDEARSVWNRALEVQPENQIIMDVRRRLER